MYKVNEQFSIGIYIEGNEMPLEAGNALTVLHIMASSKVTLPALHLQFVDMLQLVPKFGLTDGSPIVVVIKGQITITRNFRVHSWFRTPLGNGFSYTLDCYYDSPKYWATTTLEGIDGSSYSAISQIASTCGLQMWDKSTQTSDNMIWFGNNRPYGAFARDIARYGYGGEQSHMVLAVDTTGFVRYVDVNANPPPQITVGYLKPEDGTPFITVTDFKATTFAGTNNILGGYLHNRHTQSLVGEDSLESELVFTSDSTNPLLNIDVRSQINRGTISFSPIDVGNVHTKYERAKYQNARYNLLNSMQAELLFPMQVPFEPCDNLKYVAPAAQYNTDYNGEFTVVAKVVFVAGATYQEKIVAVRNGLDAK
jgi:hypothetical protein